MRIPSTETFYAKKRETAGLWHSKVEFVCALIKLSPQRQSKPTFLGMKIKAPETITCKKKRENSRQRDKYQARLRKKKKEFQGEIYGGKEKGIALKKGEEAIKTSR